MDDARPSNWTTSGILLPARLLSPPVHWTGLDKYLLKTKHTAPTRKFKQQQRKRVTAAQDGLLYKTYTLRLGLQREAMGLLLVTDKIIRLATSSRKLKYVTQSRAVGGGAGGAPSRMSSGEQTDR